MSGQDSDLSQQAVDSDDQDFELSQRNDEEEDNYQADDEIDLGEQAKVYAENEENPENSQILVAETADIDFNLDEKSLSSSLSTVPEDVEFDEEGDQVEPVEQQKLETSVDQQSKLAFSEANKLVQEVERVEAKRVRRPSSKMVEIEKTKEQLEYEKANPPPAPKKSKAKQKVPDGYASDFHESVATAATEIIQKDIRLESYSATSQAKKIYGLDFTKLTADTAKCALCDCMFKDRISYSHNKTFHPDNLKRLTITYDHFAPVNFSALVFRIPVAAGNYTPEEMNLFKLNGHMTCYHCNYEKSQRMFITCPKKGGVVDFNNFQPNVPNIRKFFNDLVNSKNAHGFAGDGSKTLDKCLKGPRDAWINKRISVITAKAQELCNQIKGSVNLENVKKRIQMTKIIIRKASQELKEDAKFIDLTSKGQYRYKREYISRVFGELELKFPKPWNQQDVIKSTDPNKQYTPVRIFTPLEKQQKIKQQQESVNRLSVPRTVNVGKTFRKLRAKEGPSPQSGKVKKGGSSRKRKTYRRIRLF
jgi:hypothetical protein